MVRPDHGITTSHARLAPLDAKTWVERIAAACLAHARHKFDELRKADASVVGDQALRRIARIYRNGRALAGCSNAEPLLAPEALSKPLRHVSRRRGQHSDVPLDVGVRHLIVLNSGP